ncbi:MAG: hypothetical protein DRG27_04340 [Deltaproteobacteria bacterium]|nr:MAG: hypothetical protein DRG27_04340 [Deltaproteobacteria bacterium]
MKILKEVLKVSIGAVCVCLLCVSLAMATITCDSSGCTTSSGTVDFKCSKNVRIVCNSNGQTYAAISDHFSGDKVYGVSSDSSVVYYTTKSKGEHYDTSGFTASDSSAFSDWSSL